MDCSDPMYFSVKCVKTNVVRTVQVEYMHSNMWFILFF